MELFKTGCQSPGIWAWETIWGCSRLQEHSHPSLCVQYEVKWSEVAQSCLTLFDPMDCSLPGPSHGIFQARVLEWVAISYSSSHLPQIYLIALVQNSPNLIAIKLNLHSYYYGWKKYKVMLLKWQSAAQWQSVSSKMGIWIEC